MSANTGGTPENKAALEARIDAARAALDALFDAHDEARLTGMTDAAGWSARDHLHHIAAWEDFQIARQAGGNPYAIFGVADKAAYDALLAQEEDFRAINEQIRQHGKDMSLAEVRDYARHARARAKGALATFTDEALARRSNPADPTSATFMQIVGGNSYEHDDEHRGYVEAILGRAEHDDEHRGYIEKIVGEPGGV